MSFLSQLSVTPEGEVFCPGGRKLIYWGMRKEDIDLNLDALCLEKKGECIFQKTCWKGKYGSAFYISEFRNLSQEMKIFRATEKFKKVYKKRQAVEGSSPSLRRSFLWKGNSK
jgi:hypothetical protein